VTDTIEAEEHMSRTYRLGLARRAINAVMHGAIALGVGPRSTYLLTTTGRTTGLPRTTPVTLVEDGRARWLVAPYGPVAWVRNVGATPRVALRRGRTTLEVTATPVPPGEAAAVLRRYVRDVPVTRPFFDVGPESPLEDFEAEAHRHPVFALHAVPGSSTGAGVGGAKILHRRNEPRRGTQPPASGAP
jgi:deazaflavin-dependent oxidoreductase (nitroreductase family)